MNIKHKKLVSGIAMFTFVVATILSPLVAAKHAYAASITAMSDTLSNEFTGVASTQTIKFTVASTIAAGGTIVITWPSSVFTSGVFGDVTIGHGTTYTTHGNATGTPSDETIASSNGASTIWGAAFTGTTLTLTSPSGTPTYQIVSGNQVEVVIAATHYLNPSAGSQSVTIATPSDTGTLAYPVSTVSPNEVINANVAPTITFSNSASTINFGTLSSSATTWANTTTGSASDVVAHTLTVATNAASGYTLTYVAPTTLTSGGNTIAALGSPVGSLSGTTGTAQFGINAADTITGTGGTVSANYLRGTPSSDLVIGTTPQTLASSTGIATSDAIALHYFANIPGSQPAGAYTTTITYIATGNF